MNIFLKPGELCISTTPTIVSTVLGSCVAVTIFNQRLRVGSICHAQMPEGIVSSQAERFRYVDKSINFMLEKLMDMGVVKSEMEVKIIGGADVLAVSSRGHTTVGKRNIEMALKIIREEGLNLVVSDVGGVLGRKIHFYTHTGKVLLKRLKEVSQIRHCP